jgi:hypothetical protein
MPYTGVLGKAGLALENPQGIFTAPTKLVRFIPPFDFSPDITPLISGGVNGKPDLATKYAQGPAQLKGGKIKFEIEPEGGIGEHLAACFGTDTMTEVASFVVTLNVNDRIDFTVDGGGAVSCQIAAGTYAMGTASSQAGTLCQLIKAGMEAASAGRTFTVTYSYATKKMTIAVDAGHVFVLLFLTGTNNSKTICALIGFSKADTTSGLNVTSNQTAGVGVYSHLFTRAATASLPLFSWWQQNALDYPTMQACMLSKLDIDIKAKEFIQADATWLGLKYLPGVTQSLTDSALSPLKFDQAILTVGGAGETDIQDLKLSFDNNVAVEHVVGNTIWGSKVASHGFGVKASGTLVVEDLTEWAKFIAGTASSLGLQINSTDMVKAAIPYSLACSVPTMIYRTMPRPIAKGLMKIAFSSDPIFNVAGSITANATLVNSVYTAYC